MGGRRAELANAHEPGFQGLVARCCQAQVSLSVLTGGCPGPQRGQDPSVCVDEEGEAGAQPVLRGRAGACGQGLGLGGLPE